MAGVAVTEAGEHEGEIMRVYARPMKGQVKRSLNDFKNRD